MPIGAQPFPGTQLWTCDAVSPPSRLPPVVIPRVLFLENFFDEFLCGIRLPLPSMTVYIVY